MLVSTWEENVILVDADWLDRFVFEVTVNFERMLERAIPKVALDRWVDYLSLDGGVRPGNNKIQVILLYDSENVVLKNCAPQSLTEELNGKAFRDNLGEFLFSTVSVEINFVTKAELFVQSMMALYSEDSIKRLMLVPNMDEYGTIIRDNLREIDCRKKEITLFATEPQQGLRCPQEILTYSIMAALGISGDELKD